MPGCSTVASFCRSECAHDASPRHRSVALYRIWHRSIILSPSRLAHRAASDFRRLPSPRARRINQRLRPPATRRSCCCSGTASRIIPTTLATRATSAIVVTTAATAAAAAAAISSTSVAAAAAAFHDATTTAAAAASSCSNTSPGRTHFICLPQPKHLNHLLKLVDIRSDGQRTARRGGVDGAVLLSVGATYSSSDVITRNQHRFSGARVSITVAMATD